MAERAHQRRKLPPEDVWALLLRRSGRLFRLLSPCFSSQEEGKLELEHISNRMSGPITTVGKAAALFGASCL